MEPFRIAGIGEVLWDILPSSEQLGGAPANFAYHVKTHGAHGIVISTIGDDARGKRARAILEKAGLETATLSTDPSRPTGYVTAELDADGVATYHFPADVAWDHLEINRTAKALAPTLDAICFGTLAQRSAHSAATIQRFIDNLPARTMKICDLNLRQQFFTPQTIAASLSACSVLKLNDDELDTLSKIFDLSGSETERLEALRTGHRLDLVILTRGAHGSILLSERERSEHPGVDIARIDDTIGAGDSFTAAVAVGCLLGRDLDQINKTANKLAAYVCSRSGAMPEIPGDLLFR